jgi:hypothetical protein
MVFYLSHPWAPLHLKLVFKVSWMFTALPDCINGNSAEDIFYAHTAHTAKVTFNHAVYFTG